MFGLAAPGAIRSSDLTVPAAIVLAASGGALAAVAPLPAVGISGATFVLIGLVVLGRRSAQVFLGALAVVLTIYAFMERGGAYIGVSPLYISEVLLFVAALALMLNFRGLRPGLLLWILLAFVAWGAARTIPYIAAYGIDALRDAVTWAYAVIALAVAASIRAVDYGKVLIWYRRLLPFFVIAMPIVAVVSRLFDEYIPKWPSSPLGSVGIITFTNGHTGVHFAGVGAFILLGLYGVSRRNRTLEPLLWAIWLVGVAIVGSLNRGSLLAAAACGLAVAFLRTRTRLMSVALLAPLILAVAAVANPVVDLGTVRKVSFDQLAQNVLSVFGVSTNYDLEGTTEWRLAWWQTIVDYTINGPYFWDGKGYGVNLADDDGFQVQTDGSLRAPHNGHVGILARAGVPGLVLWILLQAGYALGLIRAAIGAHRVGRDHWVAIHGWLFVYWVAAMINLSFDPYLEGPHGGIWFWALFGLGLGAMRAWRTGDAEDAVVAAATSNAEPPDVEVRPGRTRPAASPS
jgi:hypothetical protein